MHILVLGGTKFFGKEIVNTLLGAGHQVTVYTRGNQQPAFWDKVNHICGDRTDYADFSRQLRGKTFDAVIDNIAFTPEDVAAALDVFEDKIERYIFTSSLSVYLTTDWTLPLREGDVDHRIDELPNENPGFYRYNAAASSPYALGKLRAERMLIRQDRIPYTIIRPPHVFGPGDPRTILYFYVQRLLDGGPLILKNGGVQTVHVSYSGDLAKIYLAALTTSHAANQTYLFAQREAVRLVDWLAAAARLLDIQPEFVSIPVEVIDALEFEYPEHPLLVQQHVIDTSKVEHDLDFTYTAVDEWLGATVRWWRDSYSGPDSPGYAERSREIAFARDYQHAVTSLISTYSS